MAYLLQGQREVLTYYRSEDCSQARLEPLEAAFTHPGVWGQQSLRTDDKNTHPELSMWTDLSPTMEAEVHECLLSRKQTEMALEDW